MKEPDFYNMTKEEAEQWEKDQDNSNDLYKIAARVKNLAREDGGALTPVGDILCNSHVHVLKVFYDYAEKQAEPVRTELLELTRKQENMPAKVIKASKSAIKK